MKRLAIPILFGRWVEKGIGVIMSNEVKDELIKVMAEKLVDSQFGACYKTKCDIILGIGHYM